ncbi:mitochondrial ribonuclease P protein 1 homolog [Oppia nitens]|uniref:mitochondrial ribonuclease P protein 1 homolog n=1 Tax=Oppia nitens TaxID=1686743 RepID=UPI0023DB3507|nr:mitochondrial ribonuclease P protein 1 homolog [Oppia nitens]
MILNLLKYKHVLRQTIEGINCLKCWIRCNTNSIHSHLIGKQFDDLSVDTFTELITSDDIKDKIEIILNEYEYEKYTTLRVPTTITIDAMKDLIAINDIIDRKKMIKFLFTKELQKNKSKNKRKELSLKYWQIKDETYKKISSERTGIWDNNQQLIYGLWHNTLFSKVMKSSISRMQNHRLRRAAMFGQKLIIDLAFDDYMKLHEIRLLLKQLSIIYHYNKYETQEPFDLHFTNCDPNSVVVKEMSRFFQNYNSPNFLASIHSQSYLDLFPKQQLVYLSPHSRNVLNTFNINDIYIIGGLIDKTSRGPLTSIKAHKDTIRTARLPLDEHIIWKMGSKSLCLNHIVAILHDIKMTGDWRTTLKNNVPQRKQKDVNEIEFEDTLRIQKYKRFQRQNNY